MHPSGHTIAHEAQPMQVSAVSMQKGYPRWFTSPVASASVFVGQATMQRLQPLQRSVSITTAPFIFPMACVLWLCAWLLCSCLSGGGAPRLGGFWEKPAPFSRADWLLTGKSPFPFRRLGQNASAKPGFASFINRCGVLCRAALLVVEVFVAKG